MRLTALRDVELPLGKVTAWVADRDTLDRAATCRTDRRGPSHNQHGHISHALARRVDPELLDLAIEPDLDSGRAAATGWIGVSFEVPHANGHYLRRAFEAWVGRHETLRSGFRSVDSGPDATIERFTLGPRDVQFEPHQLGVFLDRSLLDDTLEDWFNRCTDAVSWPSYAFVSIQTRNSTTIVMAFDHVNVDGYSIMLAIGEIRELVDADHEGRPHCLPPVPSYLDFVQAELASSSLANVSHDAVVTWDRFLGDDRRLPTFPLPDGLVPGSQVPQDALCEPILDVGEADAFGVWCRANGSSSAVGHLAALALTIARLGATATGPDRSNGFRSLVSTHTRKAPCWAESLGWFTAIAPLQVAFESDVELVDLLPLMNSAWDEAKRGAALPMPRIGELLDVSIEPRFVVSYLDSRHARSSSLWDTWNAHAYLGDVGPTDEVYVWINRMNAETSLTWRFPGNDVCRRHVTEITRSMRDVILEALHVGADSSRSTEERSTTWS